MEIRAYPQGAQPMGVIVREDIVEGRAVLLTSHSNTIDFGSQSDLPGVMRPRNATEAVRATYIVAWTAPDRAVGVNGSEMYITTPAFDYALRGGFDQDSNLPMDSVDVRLTWPGNQKNQTIPSGWKAMVLGQGSIITIYSGQYVYNANLEVPGALLEALNTADDGAALAGELSYSATGTIAEVIQWNSTTRDLTIKVL